MSIEPSVSAERRESSHDIPTLIADFRAKVGDMVSSNKIVMLRDKPASTLMEKLLVRTRKILWLPSTEEEFPFYRFVLGRADHRQARSAQDHRRGIGYGRESGGQHPVPPRQRRLFLRPVLPDPLPRIRGGVHPSLQSARSSREDRRRPGRVHLRVRACAVLRATAQRLLQGRGAGRRSHREQRHRYERVGSAVHLFGTQGGRGAAGGERYRSGAADRDARAGGGIEGYAALRRRRQLLLRRRVRPRHPDDFGYLFEYLYGKQFSTEFAEVVEGGMQSAEIVPPE